MSIPQPYDTGLTEEQLAEAFRRALGDMTDEEIENAIATAINLIPKGLVYRGAYKYFSELPTNAELGEVYTVKYKGTSGTEPDGNEYAWGEYEGTLQWIPLGVDAYTKNEIDTMHAEIQQDVDTNKSDILSAENTINSIIPKLGIRISNSLSENNWYRVFSAEKKQTARSGIIMINRAYNTTSPESYTIIFNFINLNDVFRLISKNVKTQLIDAIRIVYSTTSQHERPCYIDIHYKGTTINTVNVSMHSESIAIAGTGSTFENRKFQTSDFPVAEIPEGYTSTEFSLTGDDIFTRIETLENK